MTEGLRSFVQRDVRLELGGVLPEVVTAYVTLGALAPDGRNAVLVTHGYTSGPDMVLPGTDAAEGAWSEIVGPGKAVDTDRWFVVCPNMLGSSYGSTNAASIDPATGRPYGSRFPEITMRDVVAGQKALLDHLGVTHLVAVIGPSLGGAQAFQWGVDHPDLMDALVPVVCAPRIAQADAGPVIAQLSADPAWNGGDYYPAVLFDTLRAMRVGNLRGSGLDAVLADRLPDPADRDRTVERMAAEWAGAFDANSLLILMKLSARFDVSDRLHQIRAPLLYVLSRSDPLFPPALAPGVMRQLAEAGVDARYLEINSEHGHFASGTDAERWAPALREFLAETTRARA